MDGGGGRGYWIGGSNKKCLYISGKRQCAYHPLSFSVVNGRFNQQNLRNPTKRRKPNMGIFFRFRAFKVLDLSLWPGLIRGKPETKTAWLHKITDRYFMNVFLTENTLIESTLIRYLRYVYQRYFAHIVNKKNVNLFKNSNTWVPWQRRI